MRAQCGADPARAPGSHQDEHAQERQRRMGQDINPGPPGIRQDGEDHLTRIEDRRGRVPQQRHPGVLLGLPERPPPLVPRRLNALVQPVVIFADIAIGELLIPKQHRRVTSQEQRSKTGKDQGPGQTLPHQSPLMNPARVSHRRHFVQVPVENLANNGRTVSPVPEDAVRMISPCCHR